MLSCFDYFGHVCITFDLLCLSVFDFLVRTTSVFTVVCLDEVPQYTVNASKKVKSFPCYMGP